MPPSQNVSRRPENIPPDEKSQYRWFKDTGFNGMHDFMLSCGLKPHNFEGYDEAQQIIDAMRRYDQEHWEAEHNERNQDYYEDWKANTSEPNQGYCEDWDVGLDEQRFENWEDGEDDEETMESNQYCYDEDSAADQSELWQSHYDDDWETGTGNQDNCYDDWDSEPYDQYQDDHE